MTATPITPASLPPQRALDHKMFDRNFTSFRTLFSVGLSCLVALLTLIACLPLFSVLTMLIWHGGARLIHSGVEVITQLPPGFTQEHGGGFGNALVGTLAMVGFAAAISVPFGIISAIFLAEYGTDDNSASRTVASRFMIWIGALAAPAILYLVVGLLTRFSTLGTVVAVVLAISSLLAILASFSSRSEFATYVRFGAKVLTGLPSILAGVFAYACIVMLMGFSAVAGAVALSVLMIPIVMLTAEEAIKMVPQKTKDAAIGMGCTKAQVIWKVVLPTAMPGILTGVMLAIARAAGETAPLLFTAMDSKYRWTFDSSPPFVHLTRRTASMAVFIYNTATQPYPNVVELAWAASLVLVILVLVLNIGGQLLSARSRSR